MDVNEFVKLMEKHKDDPRLGAMTEDEIQAGKRKLLFAIGGNPDMPAPKYGFQEYAQYGMYMFRENMVRPLAVGFAALAVLLGGWTGMVGASFDSVPGDVLYPVKIANEKAQFSLAFSNERKAKLRVEFASNRLDEAISLALSTEPEKETQVKGAIESFTREIEAVSQQIEDLKESDLQTAAELAKIVESKVDEYQDVIGKNESGLAEDEKTEMAAALVAVEDADLQVVDVMVENQEVNQEVTAGEDLQKKFQKNYVEINDRVNLSVGRLASIEDILLEYVLEGEYDYSLKVQQSETILKDIKPQLHEAMNILAVGGYRGAFDQVREIFSQLDQVELEIATIEIEITAQISAIIQELNDQIEEVEAEVIEPEVENEVSQLNIELTEDGTIADSELAPVSTDVEINASSVSELK
ncbi:MAG: DUF5667 domain-containing protein [Candidatus Uhrbacteria bacterium]